MKIKKVVPIILPIVFGLVACATDSPPKYRDVENLAHPPKVQGESANIVMEDQQETEETSESGKEPLGNKVYKVDSKPTTLRIKLPFKKGWYAVRLALKELDADIITFDRDEGLYTLKYKAEGQDNGQGGLLQGLLGKVLNSAPESSRYQILVKEQGAETEVTVSEAEKKKEKYIYNTDGYQDPDPVAIPETLFENLYEALREDVVMKPSDNKKSSD